MRESICIAGGELIRELFELHPSEGRTMFAAGSEALPSPRAPVARCRFRPDRRLMTKPVVGVASQCADGDGMND